MSAPGAWCCRRKAWWSHSGESRGVGQAPGIAAPGSAAGDTVASGGSARATIASTNGGVEGAGSRRRAQSAGQGASPPGRGRSDGLVT